MGHPSPECEDESIKLPLKKGELYRYENFRTNHTIFVYKPLDCIDKKNLLYKSKNGRYIEVKGRSYDYLKSIKLINHGLFLALCSEPIVCAFKDITTSRNPSRNHEEEFYKFLYGEEMCYIPLRMILSNFGSKFKR